MAEQSRAPPPQLANEQTSIPPTEERAAKRLKMDVPAGSEKADAIVESASGDVPPAEGAKMGEGNKTDGTDPRDNRQSGLAPIKKECEVLLEYHARPD